MQQVSVPNPHVVPGSTVFLCLRYSTIQYFWNVRCAKNKTIWQTQGNSFWRTIQTPCALNHSGLETDHSPNRGLAISWNGQLALVGHVQVDTSLSCEGNRVTDFKGICKASQASMTGGRETYLPGPWCVTAQRAARSCSRCPSHPHPSGCWHRCTAAGSQCCRSLWLLWSSSWAVSAAPPHQRLLRGLWESKWKP